MSTPPAILIPGQAVRRTIPLSTRRGTAIDNAQSFEVTLMERAADRDFRQRHPMACFGDTLSPCYNCHGFTFASRRTRISDSQDVQRILVEDDYEEVARDSVRPGDIVLYMSADNDGDVEHSGLVVELRESMGIGRVPMILSKWGSGAEVVHTVSDCPYQLSNIRFFRVTR